MNYSFSLLSNYRTYSVELRERDYPKFEGRYNAYVGVYGQLSQQYLGAIEKPLKLDCDYNDMPALLESAEQFINDNKYVPVSKW